MATIVNQHSDPDSKLPHACYQDWDAWLMQVRTLVLDTICKGLSPQAAAWARGELHDNIEAYCETHELALDDFDHYFNWSWGPESAVGIIIQDLLDRAPASIAPQAPPWPVGTQLMYIGHSKSGYNTDQGETVWSHKNGVKYTVMDNTPADGIDRYRDPDTGEVIRRVNHGWSTLHSELDPTGKHGKAIDVTGMAEYRVIKEPT